MHVCWNIQLALELILVQPELGQIDELAKLLGQFACKKQRLNVSKMHKHMYVGTYNSLPIELLETLKRVKLMSLPSSLGNSPAKNGTC